MFAPTFLDPMFEPSPALSALPDDVILEIIAIIIEDYHFSHYSTIEVALKHKARARAVVAASQICRQWRHAALSCQWIWGRILNVDTSPSIWVNALLERIGSSAPIYVYSNPIIACFRPLREHDFSSDIWTALFQRVAQWRILDLTIHISTDVYVECSYPQNMPDEMLLRFCRLTKLKSLVLGLTQPAPSLESFKLDFPTATSINTVREAKLIPNKLFSGITPRLTRFYYRDIVSWTISSFRTSKILTHLHIGFGGANSSAFNVAKWLEILEGQNQLVSLDIQGNFVAQNPKDPLPIVSRQIHLPSLRTLFLQNCRDIPASTALFSSLQIPPTCDVYINLYLNTPGSSCIGHLQAGFERFISSWQPFYAGSVSTCWDIIRSRRRQQFEFKFEVRSPELDSSQHLLKFRLMSALLPFADGSVDCGVTEVVNMVVDGLPNFVYQNDNHLAIQVHSLNRAENIAFDRLFSKFEGLNTLRTVTCR